MVDRDLSTDRLFSRPLNKEQLAFSLKLHSLLFERIVVPDGATLYNDLLRSLVLRLGKNDDTIRLLFQNAVAVWSQRSNAPSFSELHEFMTATHSWEVQETALQHEYLDFLEEHCSHHRVTYDYETTASNFTRLTNSCLSNDQLMAALGLSSVAIPALTRSEQNRREAVDRYSRRTAIFEYAGILDRQGRTAKARHLRQLSSVIYHGSAATELKLPIAYSDQYREALNAIHGTEIPVWSHLAPHHPSIIVAADVDRVPFYASAIELLSYDVIADIRSSRPFQKYLDRAWRIVPGSPECSSGGPVPASIK